jgi:hypothetical protein
VQIDAEVGRRIRDHAERAVGGSGVTERKCGRH